MAADRPAAYRLTPRARADLEEIWLYTAERWSPGQADDYLAELGGIFDLLVGMPEIARERMEFDPPVRLHLHKTHLLVYRLEAGYLLIIRILHRRRDWMALIEESGRELLGK